MSVITALERKARRTSIEPAVVMVIRGDLSPVHHTFNQALACQGAARLGAAVAGSGRRVLGWPAGHWVAFGEEVPVMRGND